MSYHGIVSSQDSVEQQQSPLSPSTSMDGVEMIPSSFTKDQSFGDGTARGASSEKDDRPSNESLLSIAFVSFMGFTICQTVVAFIAGSEALMGDSAAMFVDALTYLFNLMAERRKSSFDDNYRLDPNLSREEALRLHKRAKRKMTLHLELIPPLLSVSTLVAVTAVVSNKAIQVLVLDMRRDPSKQANPNVKLMFCFSLLNLFLDGFNVFCFAKAKHAMGYETSNTPSVHNTTNEKSSPRLSIRNRDYVHLGEHDLHLEDTDEETTLSAPSNTGQVQSNGMQNGHPHEGVNSAMMDHEEEEEGEEANLNMCSAYTHVFADTLRSIAVVIAATIAELVDEVTPEEADATAAVVVSCLILLSLIPLIHGLVQTFAELKAIRAEEASEIMFPCADTTSYRMAMAETQNNHHDKEMM